MTRAEAGAALALALLLRNDFIFPEEHHESDY